MKIAVASGKGGTGKTTIATNLAYLAAQNGRTVAYVDCDVEEPNGQLFLKPLISSSRPIGRLHPKVDEVACIHCGLCGEICQYSAIVPLGVTVLVYAEMCHACGGCALVCPAGATVLVASPRRGSIVVVVTWDGPGPAPSGSAEVTVIVVGALLLAGL